MEKLMSLLPGAHFSKQNLVDTARHPLLFSHSSDLPINPARIPDLTDHGWSSAGDDESPEGQRMKCGERIESLSHRRVFARSERRSRFAIVFFFIMAALSFVAFAGVAQGVTGRNVTECCFCGSLWERRRSLKLRTRSRFARTSISKSEGSRGKTRGGRIFHVVSAVEVQHEQKQQAFSKEGFEEFLLKMQESICTTAAEADGSGKTFCHDRWQRSEDPSSGYGITRVLEDGDLLEKAAANVSIVRGLLSESRAKAMSGRGRPVESGAKYFAGALSLVFHTRHPFVPTFRSDVRYFEVEGGGGWFGGGADLTPSYLFEDDAEYFHRYYKAVCDRYDPTLYQQSKAACDAYFYIPARKEHRGIGGIFFDDLETFQQEEDSGLHANRSLVFSFVKEVAEGFMPSFLPIAHKRRYMSYGEREREWQLLRRGRYLEFNLLYDRGVRFGLDGGRFESIMVSAPPLIAWKYSDQPQLNTSEGQIVEVLKSPREWISE